MGDEAMPSRVSIKCAVPAKPAEAMQRETRCLRVAQILCLDGLPLEDALAQADAEKEEQERMEAVQAAVEQQRLAIGRVRICFPEFAEEDVRWALQETCDNEDLAINLLQRGYGAPSCKPQSIVEPLSQDDRRTCVVEDFPTLVSEPTRSERGTCCTSWSKRSKIVQRSTRVEYTLV